MNLCPSCGQANAPNSNYCRFCGSNFTQPQPAPPVQDFGYHPPRPYSWKTDEFDAVKKSGSQKTQPIQNLDPVNRQNAGFPVFAPPPNSPMMRTNYQCPRCGTHLYPRTERKISTAGWIVFAVLLIAFFPLFWIGFLIKEDIHVCPICQLQTP